MWFDDASALADQGDLDLFKLLRRGAGGGFGPD
jgi:hypothetical protein